MDKKAGAPSTSPSAVAISDDILSHVFTFAGQATLSALATSSSSLRAQGEREMKVRVSKRLGAPWKSIGDAPHGVSWGVLASASWCPSTLLDDGRSVLPCVVAPDSFLHELSKELFQALSDLADTPGGKANPSVVGDLEDLLFHAKNQMHTHDRWGDREE